MKNISKLLGGVLLGVLVSSCQKSSESFYLLAAESTFKQSAIYVQRKVDILWVVDSSGSMNSSQLALAASFQDFIQKFQTKNFDFNMAVVDTAGYLAHFYDNSYSQFKAPGIMTKDTPNLETVFQNAVKVGITGTGDERAFSSLKHALSNPLNTGFHRPGALLVVIIVSDEDDFSHYDWANGASSYYFTENLADPNMFSISHFVDFLTSFTGSTPSNALKNFTVHNISILDSTCLASLANSAQKVSVRYPLLSAATGGVSASLCNDMGDVLTEISQNTIELAAQFQLDREPWPETLNVSVDGVNVPQDAVNGWTYDETTWTLHFHGTAVPAEGADVKISFEPKSPQI